MNEAPRQNVYRIEVSPVAPRELEKLKSRIRIQDYERLRDVVRSLANEPRAKGVRKLKGEDKIYRIRVGSYRVVYDVYDNDNLVLILLISRRTETIYRHKKGNEGLGKPVIIPSSVLP